jgi:hypothetical protein
MTNLLENLKKANELAEQLKKILSSIHSEMEYHDTENLDEYISDDCIKKIMIESIHDHDYEFDINNESNITYADEPEKRKSYYVGVNSGYNTAFFWLCEYLDLLNFFENEISPIFEKHRLNLIEGNQ